MSEAIKHKTTANDVKSKYAKNVKRVLSREEYAKEFDARTRRSKRS